MAITVTPNLTVLNLCEDYTTWTNTGTGTLSNNADVNVQGTNCLQDYRASANNRSAYTTLSNVNLINQNIYIWFSVSKTSILQPKGATGLRVRVYDNNLYWAEWDIAGSDTLPHGGWIPYTFNLSSTPSRTGGGGTFNPGSVARVEYLADSVAAKGYIYVDAIRYGTGLTITGGDAGTPASFESFFTADNDSANKYGVVSKIEGVYFIQGILIVGATNQATPTYFKDISKIVVFRDAPVGASFYEVKAQGAADPNTTTFYLGTKPVSSGVSGCVIKSAGAAKYKLTFSDENIINLGLYGCLFIAADVTNLPTASTSREVLNTTFDSCGSIYTSTCKVEYCNAVTATGAGFRITSESHGVANCNLVSCPYGIRFSSAGTYTLSNMKFTGSTSADLDNISGGLVTINRSNGTDCQTYTGNTVLKDSIDLTMIVKTTAGTPIPGAYAYIDEDDLSPFIMNTTTDPDGKATVNYNGSPMTNSRWRVRKYGYKDFKQLIDTGSVNIDLPVTLVADPQQT